MVSPAAMIFCRGELRSPVDLTLLRHTGATFGRQLVFCPSLSPFPSIICIPCTCTKTPFRLLVRTAWLLFCYRCFLSLLCFRLVKRQFHCYGSSLFKLAFKGYLTAVICDYMLYNRKSQTCSAYLL